MDLGTICKNLERGAKYRNSGDVYKDVQLVWENCRSYNQKGDPILDLLARVKKNFTKYWTAAGLSTEKYQGFYLPCMLLCFEICGLFNFCCKENNVILGLMNTDLIYENLNNS